MSKRERCRHLEVISRSSWPSHRITPVLKQHQASGSFQFVFKIQLLTFKSLHNLAPPPLALWNTFLYSQVILYLPPALFLPVCPKWDLLSSLPLLEQSPWISRPWYLLPTFKSHLKTQIFRQAFTTRSNCILSVCINYLYLSLYAFMCFIPSVCKVTLTALKTACNSNIWYIYIFDIGFYNDAQHCSISSNP